MLFRLTVKLSTIERDALTQIAQEELRSLPDQVRVILRDELARRGFLNQAGISDPQNQDAEE